MSAVSSLPAPTDVSTNFSTFIEDFRERLRHVFRCRADADEVSTTRGLEPFMMREVQRASPLSVFIPEKYGGRGGHVRECQAVLEAASYESLALSLTLGINGALFLQPVAKYGRQEIKAGIFERFIEEKHMGGLMITEPDYGTDALNMQTSYAQREDGRYAVSGTKHWAGLTGWADFWLVTARQQRGGGSLGRDIDFFILDQDHPEQCVDVEERFHNLGLYAIPYGRNRVDVTVPETHKLEPESMGIKMMLDTLHRSRTEFPGMGMGFLRRIMDEAIAHCKDRLVGNTPLFERDQVKKRLSRIQAYFTTCSAMCAYASEHAGIENNLATSTVPSNSVKAVVTDVMHDAAQSFLQLSGAQGYRLDHLAGRATVDSRPFQIFEGSNDVLYEQISQAVLKKMKKAKEKNLYDYLSEYERTSRAAERFQGRLDFEVDYQMPQRKLVDLGRAIGRVVSMDLVIELGDRGFREDLISNSLKVLKQDAEAILDTYQQKGVAGVVEDYMEDSSWLNYVV